MTVYFLNLILASLIFAMLVFADYVPKSIHDKYSKPVVPKQKVIKKEEQKDSKK